MDLGRLEAVLDHRVVPGGGVDVSADTRTRIDELALGNPTVDPTTLRETTVAETCLDDFPDDR